ncbi:MAG: MBL fold metallo-hydrolase [Ruminococcus sp.]|nr:MBL fold metallo-hydrolase [Ruminococcus sp.]
MQQNRNKLSMQPSKQTGQDNSQTLIIIGVGLIVLALAVFGILFLFSKDSGDSSGGESSGGEQSLSANSAVKSEADQNGNSSTPEGSAQVKVHFIDVGQGDCTLVMSHGEAMLIDSGERDDSDRVIKYLKEQGITKLSCIIVTHPHTDHMGEMPDILKAFKTDKFIMPKVPDNMVTTIMRYEKMLKQIKNQGLEISWSSNSEFRLGDAVINTYTPKGQFEELNDYSTVVKISCGSRKFLITGDTEKEEESDLLAQKFDFRADVLKVPHHGSYKGTTSELLKAVGAQYAVICCGKNNDYGHPHDSTLKRIKKFISNVYITKDNGDIVFSTDGKSLTVTTQRG